MQVSFYQIHLLLSFFEVRSRFQEAQLAFQRMRLSRRALLVAITEPWDLTLLLQKLICHINVRQLYHPFVARNGQDSFLQELDVLLLTHEVIASLVPRLLRETVAAFREVFAAVELTFLRLRSLRRVLEEYTFRNMLALAVPLGWTSVD